MQTIVLPWMKSGEKMKPHDISSVHTIISLSTVFTRRGLEKSPTYQVPAMETFEMSRPGANSDRLSQKDEELLERITQRMRRKLIEQRILSKPCFQDFDK